MKILIANYRYFVSGGPERYLFNVSDGLTARGHKLVPFSIRYSQNEPSPYSHYFVEPLGSADEVTFAEQRRTIGTLWRTTRRLFYAPDVEKAVTRLVAEERPQIAYILHYLRKLSPSLIVALKRTGLPVVVRLSDYAMLCPQAHCLRDELPCTLCIGGDLLPSVRNRCVQGSTNASVLNAVATWYHRRRRYFDLIDVFVTTTQFMHKMMLEAGVPERRLRCIPTPVDGSRFAPQPEAAQKSYVAYAGALRRIKGVHVLVEAFAMLRRRRPDLDARLRIAGAGEPQYVDQLREQVASSGLHDAVEFVGKLGAPQLSDFLGRAALSVVPSLWYENLPNAILESYSCGTPVLAADLGSLPECVVDGESGYLFRGGDARDLAERLEYCLDRPDELAGMGLAARRLAQDVYSPQKHLESLERLFAELGAGQCSPRAVTCDSPPPSAA